MSELLSGKDANPELDPMGSLVDADMGAFLIWIDQQRLAWAEQSSFLVWFEDHSEALIVSPDLPRNTESGTSVDMNWLLRQIGQARPPAVGRKGPQSRAAKAAALHPHCEDSLLNKIDSNEDMLDFLNSASFSIERTPHADS